jgi:hypothetical protein
MYNAFGSSGRKTKFCRLRAIGAVFGGADLEVRAAEVAESRREGLVEGGGYGEMMR